MKKYLPIRKVVVGAVGAGLTWVAMRLGLDLGSAAANQAAAVIVGLVFSYAEKDPRVQHVVAEVEAEVQKVAGA